MDELLPLFKPETVIAAPIVTPKIVKPYRDAKVKDDDTYA
jgi:hypothetical protein